MSTVALGAEEDPSHSQGIRGRVLEVTSNLFLRHEQEFSRIKDWEEVAGKGVSSCQGLNGRETLAPEFTQTLPCFLSLPHRTHLYSW